MGERNILLGAAEDPRQVTEDFFPYWGFGAQLRLEGKSNRKRGNVTPDMHGDAVLYLCDEVKSSGTAGFHDKAYRGIPMGWSVWNSRTYSSKTGP
jgi:hypothetical protein